MTDDLAERQSAIDFSLNSTIGSSVTENVQYFYGNKVAMASNLWLTIGRSALCSSQP
jgi:hypothetical protein